jgi:exopolysaccharide biosynthesis polyprenyl glycosylphosphotransferase
MFSPSLNPVRQQTSANWAVRLIPGVGADIGKRTKKKMTSSLHLNNSPIESRRKALNASEAIEADFPPQQRSEFTVGLCDRSNRPRRNVLIVGAGAFGRRIASCIESHPEQGRLVCGFLDDERPMGNGVIGRTSNLARLSRTSFVDEVILAAPHDRETTLDVLREARRLHLDVEMAVDLFGCEPAQTAVRRVGEFPVICLHRERLPVFRLSAKRALDLVGAGLGLLFSAPVFIVIAGLIKRDSPGPVIYSAQRVGWKGKPFRCYKFRTMVKNADHLKIGLRRHNERSGPFFKIADDPRITRIGGWLRRHSLDELPQLWNVLRGEMSLVGPRPHPLDDFATYGVEHLARLDVTPGMTGLWQVTARRDPSFEKGVELDREYIEAWSLTMDLQILFKTVLAVFRGSGA